MDQDPIWLGAVQKEQRDGPCHRASSPNISQERMKEAESWRVQGNNETICVRVVEASVHQLPSHHKRAFWEVKRDKVVADAYGDPLPNMRAA